MTGIFQPPVSRLTAAIVDKHCGANTNQANRDNANLQYLGNKTGWVRLVSSINITAPSDKKYFSELTGLTLTKDEDLAKNFVLYGGVSKYNKETIFLYKSAWRDTDILVRRAAIGNVTALHKKLQKDYEGTRPVLVSAEDSSLDLRDLIAHIDIDRRDAFVLTQLVGLSYEEVAEMCECPIGTVRSRVARARLDLQTLMNASNEAGTFPPPQATEKYGN